MRLMSVLSAAAVVGAAFAAAPASAQTAPKVQVGVLSCKVAPGVGLVFASSRQISCDFLTGTPTAPVVSAQYTGTVNRYGVDLGATGAGTLQWACSRRPPRQGCRPDRQVCRATANVAVGFGGGANVLLGGSNQTIALQPVSVEGMTGLTVAAGIGDLTLTPVPLPSRPSAPSTSSDLSGLPDRSGEARRMPPRFLSGALALLLTASPSRRPSRRTRLRPQVHDVPARAAHRLPALTATDPRRCRRSPRQNRLRSLRRPTRVRRASRAASWNAAVKARTAYGLGSTRTVTANTGRPRTESVLHRTLNRAGLDFGVSDQPSMLWMVHATSRRLAPVPSPANMWASPARRARFRLLRQRSGGQGREHRHRPPPLSVSPRTASHLGGCRKPDPPALRPPKH